MATRIAAYSTATPMPTVTAVTTLNKMTCSRAERWGLRSHSPAATMIVTLVAATSPAR
jgi:hypothetical protein